MRQYTHENLVGQKFGRLTVTSFHHLAPRSQRYWLCKCDCGGEKIGRGRSLKDGRLKSCGCLHLESAIAVCRASGPKRRISRVVVQGQKYGKLTALKYTGSAAIGWECECDCGKFRNVRANSLHTGAITSCGCEWKPNKRGDLAQRNTTHGLSHAQGYRNWVSMTHRCLKPHANGFTKYGGAGILPCDGMRKSPKAMFDAIGEKPSEFVELDRINNDLGYFCGICDDCKANGRPTNIKWSTSKEQMRNRSNNVLFTISGVTHCASEWAEKFGLTWAQFCYRYRHNKVEKHA